MSKIIWLGVLIVGVTLMLLGIFEVSPKKSAVLVCGGAVYAALGGYGMSRRSKFRGCDSF